VLQGFGCEARMEETTGKIKAYVGDNIKIDLRKIGINVAEWIGLAQDGVQWRSFVMITVMNLRIS
jgi:hypothetical protein